MRSLFTMARNFACVVIAVAFTTGFGGAATGPGDCMIWDTGIGICAQCETYTSPCSSGRCMEYLCIYDNGDSLDGEYCLFMNDLCAE